MDLKKTYFFNMLNDEEAERLMSIIISVKLKSGEKLFSENDESDSLYIIESGSVMIKKGSMVLNLLSAGSCFGEMAFLTGEKRSATITAVEDSVLLRINYSDLENLLLAYPPMAIKFYKSMALLLSKRLAEMTNSIEKKFQPTRII